MSCLVGGYFFDSKINSFEKSFESVCDLIDEGRKSRETSYADCDRFSVHTINTNDSHPFGVFEDERYYCVFLGDIYSHKGDSVEDDCPRIDRCEDYARLSIELYGYHGSSFVEELNGVFVCVLWDKVEKKLSLFSDRYGFEHLYYFSDETVFLFSTSVFPLYRLLRSRVAVDEESLADVLNFGIVFNNRSVFSKIRLCEAALRCEISNSTVALQSYWRYPNQEPVASQVVDYKAEGKRLIQAAVLSAVRRHGDVAVLLSGGLDSRLLAAVIAELGVGAKALTYHQSDVKVDETRIARAVARQVGIPFHVIPSVPEARLDDEIRRCLLLTDGQLPFIMLDTIIAASEMFPGISLVNGFLLDTLFKSGWMVFRNRDRCESLSIDRLIRIYGVSSAYLFERYLEPDFAAFLKERRVKSIQEDLETEDLGSPEQTSFAFYCRNRGRRFHYVASKAYRNYVDFIMPGTEYNLFDFAAGLPYRLRENSRFYRELIADWFPDVAAIPWDKTGRPLLQKDPSPTRRRSVYERKMKYYLQRLTSGRIDLLNSVGSFNRRFRQEKKYRDAVLEILSDKECCERGVMNKRGLERLVKEQLQGRDYAVFFRSLLGLEMLHRIMDEI